jgi:hypothetical protein
MLPPQSLTSGENIWVGLTALSTAIVFFSSIADRRRNRRTDINAVGFMPWTLITVMSLLAAVVSAALAIKAG